MIAALLVTLTFAGGDLGDLARTVGRWSQRPTIALVQAVEGRPMGGGPSEADAAEAKRRFGIEIQPIGPRWKPAATLKPFEMGLTEIGDGKSFRRLIAVKSRLEAQAKEGGVALWDPLWQPSTTFVEGGGIPLPDGWKKAEPEALKMEGATATIHLPAKQAIPAEMVARMKWTKPVKVHWLLSQMWVVPEVTRGGEKETLGALALAVSGKLVETPGEYRIDLDPVAFRTRAQATVAAQPIRDPQNPLAVASHDILRQAWYQVDDATILALYAEPHMGLSRSVKANSPLGIAFSRYLAALRVWVENPPEDLRSVAESYRGMLSRIDPQGEARIVMTQNLGVGPGFARIGGGTIMP